MCFLIDTHAHLSDLKQLKSAIKRAQEAEISAIVAVSANLVTSIKTMRIAEEYPGYVYPALGLHPTEIREDFQETLMFIEAGIERCVAVGEVGLDFWRSKEKPSILEEKRRMQIYVYTKQLEIAERYKKPILIHSRGAWRIAFQLALSMDISKAIFHWFTGPIKVLKDILNEGYLISASPAVEYSKAHRSVIKETPLEKLVLETDCPVAFRGVLTEPTDILRTLKGVAELKEIPEDKVRKTTTRNALELFNLSPHKRKKISKSYSNN